MVITNIVSDLLLGTPAPLNFLDVIFEFGLNFSIRCLIWNIWSVENENANLCLLGDWLENRQTARLKDLKNRIPGEKITKYQPKSPKGNHPIKANPNLTFQKRKYARCARGGGGV